MTDLNLAIKLSLDSEAYRLRGIIHKVAHEYDKSLIVRPFGGRLSHHRSFERGSGGEQRT
jgi:hypothetical protein